MSNSGNLRILFCDTFCRIDHHKDNIGTLYCTYSTDDTITLQFFLDLILSTKTCCVDKNVFLSVMHDLCINRISCCTCDIGYNYAVLTKQTVYDRGFTNIWFTYDCDTRTVVILF